MTIRPTSLESQHWNVMEVAGGKTFVELTGIATIDFPANGANWRRDDLEIALPLPAELVQVRNNLTEMKVLEANHWTANAEPCSFGVGQLPTTPIGFAVDEFHLEFPDSPGPVASGIYNPGGVDAINRGYAMKLRARLAASGQRAWLGRVSYRVTLLGTPAWRTTAHSF